MIGLYELTDAVNRKHRFERPCQERSSTSLWHLQQCQYHKKQNQAFNALVKSSVGVAIIVRCKSVLLEVWNTHVSFFFLFECIFLRNRKVLHTKQYCSELWNPLSSKKCQVVGSLNGPCNSVAVILIFCFVWLAYKIWPHRTRTGPAFTAAADSSPTSFYHRPTSFSWCSGWREISVRLCHLFLI